MIVNFMIIGSMKSGTTTLSNILSHHPQVSFCRIKEPDFFSKSDDWKAQLNEYEALFNIKEGVIYGEGSTSYTKYPDLKLEIWKDIFDYNPKMKFIYLVRNPVQRTISHYMHIYERGYIDHKLEEALIRIPELVNYSRYFTQINPFIKQFGRRNILLLDFDDLNKNRDVTLLEVSEFLKIDPGKFVDFENIHSNVSIGGSGKINYKYDFLNKTPFFLRLRKSLRKFVPDDIRKKAWKALTNKKSRTFSDKPSLDPLFQKVIINLLDLEIAEMEKLMNKDLSHWRAANA